MFSHANTVSSGSLASSSTDTTSSSSSASPPTLHAPLPPPRLLIPDGKRRVLPGAVTPTDTPRKTVVMGVRSNSNSSTTTNSNKEENTGRWSEDEHRVFLEGLEQHGKQWKLIAGMIGTRTVVQVRTHAQKYFQKLERSNLKEQQQSTNTSIMSKRKSFPDTSSRKKAKTRKGHSATMQRSASMSLATGEQQPISPIPQLANSISDASVTSADSSVSPIGVADIDLQGLSDWSSESMFLDAPTPSGHLDGLSDDPLEWLLGGGMQHLPESSLVSPAFPEFDPTDCPEPIPIEEAIAPVVAASQPPPPQQQLSPNNTTSTTVSTTTAPQPFSDTATLNMADPKVSVQSLLET